MASSEWLNALLGAGAVGTIGALYKGIKEFREGSWKRNSSAIADLERWRRLSDDAREWEAVQHQWWRDYAGRLVFVITTMLGADKLPPREPYPKHPGSEEEEK